MGRATVVPWGATRPTGAASGSCRRSDTRPVTGSTGSSTSLRRHTSPASEATAYLAQVRADLGRGVWIDPFAGKVPLSDYSWRWLDERPNLRPRTKELYASELKLHILPVLGAIEIGALTPTRVGTWHAGMLGAARPGPTTVAKCYRLLRAILGTATEDGLILKNPCAIKGGGVEHHPERPVATIEQVFELAERIDPKHRAMVLLAAFTGLRLGELLALTPRDVNLVTGTVKVSRQIQELAFGGHYEGPPKSDAGRRTVAIPAVLLPMIADHIATSQNPAFVFGGAEDKPLRRGTFYKAWHSAVEAVGLPDFGFTTCDIPATRWRRRPAPARRSSWPAWATARRGLR